MQRSEKVKTFEELAKLVGRGDGRRQRVVHCHGVFDLLHIGHIRYLQKARQMGDLLVVTVTPDRFVNKGLHRPVFSEALRSDAIAALDCVDYVAVNQWPTAVEAIERLVPDVYAKGAEFRDHKTPELMHEEEAVAAVGARVEYIEEVTSSSSRLINSYLSPFSDEVEQDLTRLRQRYTLDVMLDYVAAARPLKLLVVGEAIIDEYYYCSAIGQSAKAPIVATRYESHERFAGGALAVANHLAGFCDQVDLVSMLGRHDTEEEWIRDRLHDNISATFLYKEDASTIVKRRYRESYFDIPLFAINFLNDDPLTSADSETFCKLLEGSLSQYDAIVVADYGHSFLGEPAIKLLVEGTPFLAVSTQANSANIGFHTISKYSRVDHVALSRRDLELECRDSRGDVRELLQDVARRLGTTTAAVTLGRNGCLCYNTESGFQQSGAVATTVIDRIGAADAFFAVSTLCAVLRTPADILAFWGNVAGAESVAVVGNSRTIDSLSFSRHIESLLK
jgi:rfaE bifunctional protein nucleotidyltransferase chain/domain